MEQKIYEIRKKKVRKILASTNLDGIVFSSLENIRYLCGFTGSDGIVLITKNETFFLSDSRYWTQSEEEVKEATLVKYKKKIDGICSLLIDLNLKAIGFESNSMTYSFYHSLLKKLEEKIRLIPLEEEMKNLRAIKDENELDFIKTSINISSMAFNHVVGIIREGIMERDIAIEMEFFMKKNGAQAMGFDTIVASGKRSSLPHGRASNKKIEKGDFILIDFGAQFNGYFSDQTRTLICGKSTKEHKKIYEVVKEAQKKAIETVRPGIFIYNLDEVARSYIRNSGYGDYFGHGLGHGIGLSVHEDPTINWENKDLIQEGMVFTIEPGIYVPNWGGVRIEDMVVVTSNGIEQLTYLPKELIEI